MKKETTDINDLFKILDIFDALGCMYWLDGGWGVDALFGKQTRPHRDVDIDFDSRYFDEVLSKLQGSGWNLETDWRPVRLEFHHPDIGYLDIHPFVLGENGTAKQADLEGGWYEFEADYFGHALFESRHIPCISLKGQKVFHTGYEPREIDLHDIEMIDSLLCKRQEKSDS